MSENGIEPEPDPIEIQPMSVDQFAGAVVLILGAIGSLLLVIWQSKCHCKMNLCWIFQCERRPPSEEEMKSLKDQAKDMKKKQDKTNKKADEILDKEEEILEETQQLQRKDSMVITELTDPPNPSKDTSPPNN
tara:strand:+ start:1630 stop:2028 length:399 start_codon:yes stop_codon:yes gene_type:complete